MSIWKMAHQLANIMQGRIARGPASHMATLTITSLAQHTNTPRGQYLAKYFVKFIKIIFFY